MIGYENVEGGLTVIMWRLSERGNGGHEYVKDGEEWWNPEVRRSGKKST